MNEKPRRERNSGRIFLRGQVGWIQYYSHGAQIRESTGIRVATEADRKKVEKKLRQKIGEVEAGVSRETRSLRYEDLRESYLADYVANGRKSLRHDKDGNPYLDKVTRLDGFFSGFRASEIDADRVRKFVIDQQGRELSNASINRSIAALKRMFNLAKQDGKVRNVPYFPMLKESSPRAGFLEREQYEELSRRLPDYLRLPVAIGFFTGMREGEILSLDWDQVDLLASTINLRPGETKNDQARTIPIVPQLHFLLVEQRGRRQPGCRFVCFRLDRGGHAVKISGFRKAWYSACVKAGLGTMEAPLDREGKAVMALPRGPRSKPKAKMIYRGTIFHDLRRTGVRNLVRAGVPERVAMSISGHRTRSVFERYNIVSQNDVAEAGRKLAAFHDAGKFGDISGTESTKLQQVSSPIN
jgi:integrase